MYICNKTVGFMSSRIQNLYEEYTRGVVISHKYWEHTSPVPDTASEQIKHSSPKLRTRMFVHLEKQTNYLCLLPYESTLNDTSWEMS